MRALRFLSSRAWVVGVVVFWAFLAPTARAQYVLEDEHNPHRYDPGFVGIPFFFYSDEYRATAGAAGMYSGVIQPQASMYLYTLVSTNQSYGALLGMDDLQLKPADRIFLNWDFAFFRTREDLLYIPSGNLSQGAGAGGNNSSKRQFIKADDNDVYGDFTFRYLLPVGDGKEHLVERYRLREGLPIQTSPRSLWNPLDTGRTFFEVTPFFEFFDIFSQDAAQRHWNTSGLQFGLTYDNSDFPLSPSSGNITHFVFTRDFGLLDSSDVWSNVTAEFSQFISLGRNNLFRQQVLALDGWTSYTPTLTDTEISGRRIETNAPPFYDGAALGGMEKMRAYPQGRFHDRAGLYACAELRFIPNWNPLGQIPLLKPADLTWMQFVLFGELGRVGPNYSMDNLTKHLKGDAGVGLRILSQDTVFRIDIGASSEGASVWANFGQAF